MSNQISSRKLKIPKEFSELYPAHPGEHGYLRRDGDDGRYRLGMKF